MAATNGGSKQLTTRLAMWSARHGWPVIVVWLVVVTALVAGGLLGLGTRTRDLTDAGEARTEAARGNAALQAGGIVQPETLLVVVSHPTLKVTDAEYKATVLDVAARLSQTSYSAAGSKPQPAFSAVYNYYAVPNPQFVSADQSSTQVVAPLSGDQAAVKAQALAGRAAVAAARQAHPAYQIYSYSGVLADAEFSELLSSDLESSLKFTLPLTLIILLIAFGAVVAALVPIVMAMLTLATTFSVMAIYSHLVAKIDLTVGHVVVMIGLAVGIDYSLFIITRYRSERRRLGDKFAALEVASGTAGRAVFFSGLTVMISLAGLLAVPSPSFSTIAIGAITVVAVSILASLTFLPALLSVLGRGIDGGRIPYFGREREEGSGLWGQIVRSVVARPIFFAVSVTVLLLALSTPLLHIRLGSADQNVEALPPSLEVRKAADILQAKWPQGTTLTLDLIVQANAPQRADVQAATRKLDDAVGALLREKGVETAAPDGRVRSVSYTLPGDSNSQSNWNLVRQVRHELVPAAFAGVPGVNVYVAGEAAGSLDATEQYTSVLPLVFSFVLGLSFILLLVAFRSLVIPIKAILLNLLSAGATYGLIILIFQDGLFKEQLGVTSTGVIAGWLPIFLFAIVFGLSMDYHLFVLTRIKEERDRGYSSNEAVERGISATSGTVTNAAAIMVVVFAVFATLQLLAVKQLGLGLAVAVFIDATIIRSVLLPATMRLLGDWNWWLPTWLGWLPRITIEGGEAKPLPPVEGPAKKLVEAEAHLVG